MGFLQFCGSVISFVIGFLIFTAAKSAIHETLAMTFLIVSAVLFSGGAITECLQNMNKTVKNIADLLATNSATKDDMPQSRPVDQLTISPQKEPTHPEKEILTEKDQPLNGKAVIPQPAKRSSWVEQAKKEIASESTKT